MLSCTRNIGNFRSNYRTDYVVAEGDGTAFYRNDYAISDR